MALLRSSGPLFGSVPFTPRQNFVFEQCQLLQGSEAPATLPLQGPAGLGAWLERRGGTVVFPVICRKETKWEVECGTVSGWAVPPRAPPPAHSGLPAPPGPAAPGPVSTVHGVHLRAGRNGLQWGGGRSGSAGLALLHSPSTHGRGALTLGASWRLARQWMPAEPGCGDLGLSCPGVPDVPCASISPSSVAVSPNLWSRGSRGLRSVFRCRCLGRWEAEPQQGHPGKPAQTQGQGHVKILYTLALRSFQRLHRWSGLARGRP